MAGVSFATARTAQSDRVADALEEHLDLPALEQLEQALASYDGALLLVSHDRRLLENVGLDRRRHVEHGHVPQR